MVKVYMESNSHAQLVAIFANEDAYGACSSSLDKYAAEGRMFITESLDHTEEEWQKFQEIGG